MFGRTSVGHNTRTYHHGRDRYSSIPLIFSHCYISICIRTAGTVDQQYSSTLILRTTYCCCITDGSGHEYCALPLILTHTDCSVVYFSQLLLSVISITIALTITLTMTLTILTLTIPGGGSGSGGSGMLRQLRHVFAEPNGGKGFHLIQGIRSLYRGTKRYYKYSLPLYRNVLVIHSTHPLCPFIEIHWTYPL